MAEPTLIPRLVVIDQATAQNVLRGVLDQCRSGAAVRWRGHAAVVEVAARVGDEELRQTITKPWFSHAALMQADDVDGLLCAYRDADPTGTWIVELLDSDSRLPVEVLALLAKAVDVGSAGAAALPWRFNGGGDKAIEEYGRRLLELAAGSVPRGQWGVLSKLGATWDGTLGDLIACVEEVA